MIRKYIEFNKDLDPALVEILEMLVDKIERQEKRIEDLENDVIEIEMKKVYP